MVEEEWRVGEPYATTLEESRVMTARNGGKRGEGADWKYLTRKPAA